jgi:hypothetical protein
MVSIRVNPLLLLLGKQRALMMTPPFREEIMR